MPLEVDEGNRLNDIIVVKVDLNKMSRFYGNFDINNIQKEVCIQTRYEGMMQKKLLKNITKMFYLGLIFQFLKTQNAHFSLN